MRKTVMNSLVLVAGAVVYSHAIFGIGGQWSPALGLEVKQSKGTVDSAGTRKFVVDEKGVSGLNGLGLKLWLDFLPLIDIELGTNIQYGVYDLALTGPISPTADTTIEVKYDFGIPLVPTKPVFARIVSDISVLYPFLKLPPLISLVKVYGGAGVSHVLGTQVMTADFAKSALAKAGPTKFDPATSTPADAAKVLADAIIDEGLKSGFGFHLVVGAKAKPPIVPIAVFANFKYHILSGMPSVVDGNSITMELGGALAF